MGHFWSVAKGAPRFGCAKHSNNLKRYLLCLYLNCIVFCLIQKYLYRLRKGFKQQSVDKYRVSHGKVWKVILLWWGYTFIFFEYKRSYVFLRNPHFCLPYQFLLKQCCGSSMVQFANMQTFWGGKRVWMYQM